MTTGEKLIKLRKEHGYTQEQLADILEVTRQSVSRWESDLAFPETDKLIKLSELYNVCVDYLLKESCSEPFNGTNEAHEACQSNDNDKTVMINLGNFFKSYEYKSKKTIFGMPLVHINIGLKKEARGFIAIGLRARGIISLGLLSLGVLSLGVLSLGIISLGVLALGLLALGSIAIGFMAIGAVAVGLFALGALAIGQVAVGAAAYGNYFAYGNYAKALVAVGNESVQPANVYGTYTFSAAQANLTPDIVQAAIDEYVPAFFRWFCIFR